MGRRAGRGRGKEGGVRSEGRGLPEEGKGPRAHRPPPARPRRYRPGGGGAGEACLEGTRARARTLHGPRRSPSLFSPLAAQRLAGWREGAREGAREGGQEGGREGTHCAGLRVPAFHLRSEFVHLRADSEKAHVWPGPMHTASLISSCYPGAQR